MSVSLRFDANRRIIHRTHQERADAPPTCLPGQGGTRKGMWPTRQLYGHTISTLASVTTEFSHVYITQAVYPGNRRGSYPPRLLRQGIHILRESRRADHR